MKQHRLRIDGREAAASLAERNVRELTSGRHTHDARVGRDFRSAMFLLDVLHELRVRRAVEATDGTSIHARLRGVLIEHVLSTSLSRPQYGETVRTLTRWLWREHQVGRLGWRG